MHVGWQSDAIHSFLSYSHRLIVRRYSDSSRILEQYGDVPAFANIAGGPNNIAAVKSSTLESKIRRAHSLI